MFAGIGFVIWAIASYSMTIREMNKESRERQCVYETVESFKGKITRINRYEYSDYMNKNLFGLEIKTQSPIDTIIEYQFEIKKYADLLKSVNLGDTILKLKNKNTFELTKDGGKKYKTPHCD